MVFSDQLWAVMNTVLDAFIIIDNKGLIQAFNPPAVKIFGYQPEEVLGKNIKILMPESYSSHHDSYLNNYISTNNAKIIGIGREVLGKRKNGEEFFMELGVNELKINDIMMFAGTVRDISERKSSEEKINSYILALSHSNQELEDFAYIASHDLKEPLRGISNHALFLKEDYKGILKEDGIRRVERISYLCEYMERLVNDLLHFSRIGNQQLAIKEIDLNDIVDDVMQMFDSVLIEKNVKILIPKRLPSVICDVVRIKEVFMNLIANAIKYNDKKEKIIEIGFDDNKVKNSSPAKNKYVFYVKDNGIGIHEDYHDDIFRIFNRLNEEDESVKGTGVGLTFVKKIIDCHRGSIWVDSTPSVGSTFYFTIQGHNLA